jgi:hypothetical protein
MTKWYQNGVSCLIYLDCLTCTVAAWVLCLVRFIIFFLWTYSEFELSVVLSNIFRNPKNRLWIYIAGELLKSLDWKVYFLLYLLVITFQSSRLVLLEQTDGIGLTLIMYTWYHLEVDFDLVIWLSLCIHVGGFSVYIIHVYVNAMKIRFFYVSYLRSSRG